MEIIKVRMTQTARGALDSRGLHIALHTEGEVYDLPDHLALAYIGGGLSVRVGEEQAKPETEDVADVEESEDGDAEAEPTRVKRAYKRRNGS